jgi:hypothetical protein
VQLKEGRKRDTIFAKIWYGALSFQAQKDMGCTMLQWHVDQKERDFLE